MTNPGTNERYHWEDFRLDVGAYRLERAGAPVALEPKALDLLVLLLRRRGRLVSKPEIFDTVWPATAVSDHALTRVVAQLRRALGDEARESRSIETVPTRGYRWIADVSVDARPDAAPAPPVAIPRAPARPRLGGPLVSALAALAVLAIGGFAWFLVQRESPDASLWATADPDGPPSASFPRQVTTARGLDLHPSIGPDGSLAFASDRTGALELYVRALSGEATDTALTRDGGQNVQPAWSPDGRFIAYHSAGRGGVWVIPARGGIARQVADVGSHPAWSPDGRRIAYDTDELADLTPFAFIAQAGATIRTVYADGSGGAAVTEPGEPFGGHGGPVWSPDGRRIAFTTFEAGHEPGIWAKDLQSGALTSIARGAGMYELAYAPDGSAIYAAGGDAVLWRVPLDPKSGEALGARTAVAIPNVPGVRGLSASRTGHIAFAGIGLDSQIWAAPIDAEGRATGTPRALTNDNTRRTSVPHVSPDGTRVAYMARRHGEPPNIFVVSLDGGSPVQITTDEAIDAQPRWMPDSRRVAFFSNRDNRFGLWSVDVETRRASFLVDARDRLAGEAPPTGVLAELVFSPDFSRVAFSVLTPPTSRRRLHVASLTGPAGPSVVHDPRSVGYPAWSPDGRSIAVEVKDGSSTHLAIVRAQGGPLRMVVNERGQSWVRSWSPDGSRLSYAAARRGVWSLRSAAARGGADLESLPAQPVSAYVRYPEWSPKGGVLVYERGQSSANIWVVRLQ